MKLLLATTNQGKIKQLKSICERSSIEAVAPQDLNLGSIPEVEETADNYLDNAKLKAVAFSKWSGLPALADDSGIEVFALAGRPGIHSARMGETDDERIENLLEEMRKNRVIIPHHRYARYICWTSIAIPAPDQPDGFIFLEGDGQLLGNIQPVRKGTKGFGYDSIFYANPLKSTVAEADQELVAKINHRAQAVEMVINKFKDHLNGVAPSA